MHSIQKLISAGSGSLAPEPGAMPQFISIYKLGEELFQLLQLRNGFYAFEAALHVFPLTSDPTSGLEGWNSELLWRGEFRNFAYGLLFFAEDIFQDQFCLSLNQVGVFRFFAESGETKLIADSIEQWANRILADYQVETGWPLAHEWQKKFGPLKPGLRLMPKIPFFLGGEYNIDNLYAGNPLEGMRVKGNLAMQTKDLPSGSIVKLNIASDPKSDSDL